MDLGDGNKPSQGSTRANSRFKNQTTNPKPSAPLKAEAASQQECQDADALSSKKMELDDVSKASVTVTPKNESSMSNIIDKMEVDAETERQEVKEDDEVDDVVRTVNVFFKPVIDANTKLYVLQYPLRPSWRSYELETLCEEVRVKPHSLHLEVDLSMDTDSKNYDSDNTLNMSKLTLSSLWGAARKPGYAIGIMMNNKLYLNPAHAVVQLRPSMEHLMSGGSKKKSNVTGKAEGTVKGEGSIGSSKKQNKQMESSIEKKPDDEELWVPLKYHGSESDIWKRYLNKLVAEESSPIYFKMKPYDYLNSFCPGNTKPKGPSRRYLLSLHLDDRIQKLLYEGVPIKRFSVLKHFAPDASTEDVLEVVQKHARLVQGLWVPKKIPGLDNAALLARDYILVLFSKNSVVKIAQLDLPSTLKKFAIECLETVSVKRSELKDWKFKENTDFSFIKLYPYIVEKQKQVWEHVEQKVIEVIGNAKSRVSAKNAMPRMTGKPGTSIKSDKGEKKASGVQIGMSMSKETREALSKALQKLFQSHKVCSFGVICDALRSSAVFKGNLGKVDASSKMAMNAAYGLDAPPEELKAIINQYAVEINGYYVLKSSPDHPEHDQLREVVINLLCGKGPDAKLKKAEISQAAKIALARDITNNEYNKVMGDFCVFKNGSWVLKTGAP